MYRTLGSLVVAVVLTAGSTGTARAEIMDTTGSLAAGQFSLGFELQAGLAQPRSPTTLLNIHEAVGLAGGLDLYARQGISLGGGGSLYFGAGIKWAILRDGKSGPGLALWGGGHVWTGGGGGGDATLLLDHRFGSVTPYFGADLNIEVGGGEVDTRLGLLGGVRIIIVQHVAWFVEGGVGIVGDPALTFLSTGPKIVF